MPSRSGPAGVDVNVVLDGYGSAKLDGAHRERLEQAGVNVSIFRPLSWYQFQKLNNRMHRRILLVDGTVGFAGGVGVADVWMGDAQDPEAGDPSPHRGAGRARPLRGLRRTGPRPRVSC